MTTVEITTPPMRPVPPQGLVHIRVIGVRRAGNCIYALRVCGHSIRLCGYVPVPIPYAPPCPLCEVGAPPEPWFRVH